MGRTARYSGQLEMSENGASRRGSRQSTMKRSAERLRSLDAINAPELVEVSTLHQLRVIPLGGELRRRLVRKRTVRVGLVVIHAPCSADRAGFSQFPEPVFVQTLVAKLVI